MCRRITVGKNKLRSECADQKTDLGLEETKDRQWLLPLNNADSNTWLDQILCQSTFEDLLQFHRAESFSLNMSKERKSDLTVSDRDPHAQVGFVEHRNRYGVTGFEEGLCLRTCGDCTCQHQHY